MADVNQVVLAVDDRSQVADARRQAQAMGTAQGFEEDALSRLSICVTETATNLIKHAGRGRIFLRPLEERTGTAVAKGVEVLSLDSGPGIESFAASLEDGHSTAGSPGTGLGSILRQGSGFDVYSHAGKGTALRFEIWPRSARRAPAAVETGVVTWPKAGEQECGDTCALVVGPRHCSVMVVDGLGHGPQAATASRAATAVFAKRPDDRPEVIVESIHAAIADTRGAAGSLATVDLDNGQGAYCGVGNITGLVYANRKPKHLISHNGTLGHNARRMQAFDFTLPPDALLILFSDGLVSHWSFDEHPGLATKHPGLIAAVLARDHNRGRDDVCIAVLRRTGH